MMRICLIGQNRGDLDEGMRNITYALGHMLEARHCVAISDPRDFKSKAFWRDIRIFRPDIIHYLHGPTLRSFVLVKLLSLTYPSAKCIVSATHPILSYFDWKLLVFLKPDLVLTQSSTTEDRFTRAFIKTEPFPSGVDIHKFKPVSTQDKALLRKKYGIPEDIFLILHIGSIRTERNVQELVQLQKDDNQILIVGHKSAGQNSELCEDLKKSGILVWDDYIRDVQEIYAMADCYIYPTVSRYDYFGRAKIASIEMPLTVLEAMACNIPVISTKFEALPRFITEGEGFYFVSEAEEIPHCIEEIKTGIPVNTRDKVTAFSWENITESLEDIYAASL